MRNDDWNTPEWIVELVQRFGPIDLDPCSNVTSLVPAVHKFGNCDEIPGNGLHIKWERFKLIYVNMPFSNIFPWTRKARHTRSKIEKHPHCQIIATVPADRTETKAWTPIWESADAIALTRKRVLWLQNGKKGKTANTTRGSTGIIYWGLRKKGFINVFRNRCRIITDWV